MTWEIRRYINYWKKSLFHRNQLNFLILYATSKCNLSCGTCFFYQYLNQKNDLTLLEYKKISASAGRFSILGLAGGEPFLNSDLEKICAFFVKKNQIDTLFIPTNGLQTDLILEKAEGLLKIFPGLSLSVNPSLDGLAEYHDRNRGRSGTFEKCLKTIEGLGALKKKYSNLQVIVNTVINRENFEEVEKLMEFLKKYPIDFQAFELMRGDFPNQVLSLPDLEKIKEIHQKIILNRFYYLSQKQKAGGNKILFYLEKVSTLGILRLSQIFKENALSGERWLCPCPAGKTIFVVNPDGGFGVCELLPPLVDLERFDFDLKKMFKSKELRRKTTRLKDKKCDCTHICFIHSAIAQGSWSFFRIIRAYFQADKIINQ